MEWVESPSLNARSPEAQVHTHHATLQRPLKHACQAIQDRYHRTCNYCLPPIFNQERILGLIAYYCGNGHIEILVCSHPSFPRRISQARPRIRAHISIHNSTLMKQASHLLVQLQEQDIAAAAPLGTPTIATVIAPAKTPLQVRGRTLLPKVGCAM